MTKTAENCVVIRGGRVIDPANHLEQTSDILIQDGVIRQVGKIDPPSEAQIIDADGLIVAPGLVDMHVHLREPGFEYKETIVGGCESAAAGGVTSMAAMPNTRPAVDDISTVRYVLEQAAKGLVNVFPIGATTKGLKGEEITEMGLLQQAGCVAFSDDGLPIMSSQVMRRALEYSKAFDALIIQHAEDLSLSSCGCINEGVVSTRLGLPGIPGESEDIIVDRDIRLARLTGGRYHVAHISTAGAVTAVKKAQDEGLSVSCEAAPHHFALIDEHVIDYDANFKMSPPLRSHDDRQAVLDGLAQGTIAVIATDHAPHDMDSKRVEFCKASNGVVGLETMLPVSLELVRDGVMDLSSMIAAMSCNPARLLGIDRGTLSVGAVADLVLFDLNEPWVVDAEKFRGKAKNSCFHGRRVQGRVKETWVSGRRVYKDEGVDFLIS
ncbi:dihydroorotase [Magnetococcales bacterium HHB-1]